MRMAPPHVGDQPFV